MDSGPLAPKCLLASQNPHNTQNPNCFVRLARKAKRLCSCLLTHIRWNTVTVVYCRLSMPDGLLATRTDEFTHIIADPASETIHARLLALPVQRYELAEFGFVEVGDCPERHAVARPALQVVAVAGLCGIGRRCPRWPGEQVDDVFSPAIDQGCRGVAFEVLQASPEQRESLHVFYCRGKVEFAVEPGLHSVLIGRGHVQQVHSGEGSNVGGEYIRRQELPGIDAGPEQRDVPDY
jgi:hypothetical protein